MNEANGAGPGAGGTEATEAGTGAEDRAWMESVQRGDEAAFGRLMERWERPVKSVIARLVFNAGEAEELAQETFVRVWLQREKYRPGAAFRPWVFAIAVNLARNRLRWWRRRPEVALEEWTERDGDGGAEKAGGAGGLELAEQASAVRDAIANLPTELREALVLFEYQEMSHAEIAAAVGATPKAVETRIHRAREKLQSTLKRWL